MHEFRKADRLNDVHYEVRGPLLDEAERIEASGQRVLKLNIGNPASFGFRTPQVVVDTMRDRLADVEGYSSSRGLEEARQAIFDYESGVKGIPNVRMENIYTGNGASELINLVMTALLNDGDEILIPAPDYPLWTAAATLSGGHVVHYLCDEQSNWYPDLDDIRSKVTARTRAIVVINPNNPSGVNYPPEILQGIVDIAREHGLMIMADEIYDRLLMDGKRHTSIASLAPDLFCITFNGLSKSHMVCGYRIGWMVLSGRIELGADLIEGINTLSSMRLCSNVPAQSIVKVCLGASISSTNDYLVPGGRIYDQREYIYNALNSIDGVSVTKPDAAFYIFPRLDVRRFGITDDNQFALDLLRRKRVLVVRGTGFNWPAPDHFRIVYLPDIDTLRQAMEALADFLSDYHQGA
ncbi:MAG: aminotransferase class I/II-fold pyridoxal phosphate-dependent enzyme [Coriobacteriales bacterium]|jgi:alanine-synthesizing transaminase